ncbi:MAG: efflux RND transporter periplasmic adaptor subunit [Nitrospira sp.]|nr:efflux RND transporter periplasmic adaptor subunit [Nitrospira sp.]MDE0406048.1 efflux RND transporter periplasmic adaptor subunit [Nitrospira sp.]MDE0486784.1 efflux RND transporter periplasmic adaptor subunit [Nitrospira sp.]
MTCFRAISLSMIGLGAAILVIAALTSLDAAGQHAHDENDHADSHETRHDDHGDHGETVSEAGTHEDVHDDHEEHGEESGGGVIELSAESIQAAGIHVTTLKSELLPEFISAPGEIQLDQYRSAEVTPLIDAVVVKRHARLGDEVKHGQPLITLASVEVAAAQGELRILANEWQRLRRLGRGVVSAKHYVQARVAYEQSRLKLSAYGLDNKQINAVVTRRMKVALGQFQLTAPVSGTVLRDDFRVGQRIKTGHSLFLIADERRVWVEASLPPLQARHVEIGVPAQVKIGGHWHEGKVIQKHHLLNEQTRTIQVRIEIQPHVEYHHTGEFVQVAIATRGDNAEPTLAVPESALVQDDEGNWTVFVEFKPGHFKQTRIRRGPTRGQKIPVSGIAEGTPVVTEGAFYLGAELAKSGFEIHSH